MPLEGITTFKILRWDETPYSEVEGAGKLTTASIDKSFEGDLVGTGALNYLMNYQTDDITNFVGYERIVGKVGGRSGSFVLKHEGIDDGKVVRGTCVVVTGSATGELTGLEGGASYALGRSDEFTMTFSFDFP